MNIYNTKTFTQNLLSAITNAAKKMFSPIIAASLTTIAAFIPLLLIDNIIGSVLKEIPIVITCFIIASLIECFFILPGHLYHSFKKKPLTNESKFRKKIQKATFNFIETKFRPFATKAITRPLITVLTVFSIMLVSIGLIIGKHISFNLFPSPDDKWIFADVIFNTGTPEKEMDKFLSYLKEKALETEKELEKNNLIKVLTVNKYQLSPLDQFATSAGATKASIV